MGRKAGMLWGRTATSSPSLVFSKTFTSTNYPGKRKTKKQHLSWAESNFICIRQRSEALNSSTRDHEEIKIREAAFFHNPQHPQRPTRCTHMSACVRVHTHTPGPISASMSLLAQVPLLGPRGKTVLQNGLRDQREKTAAIHC